MLNTYAVDTAGALATVTVRMVVDAEVHVNAVGMLAPTLRTVHTKFWAAAVPTVSVKSVPVVVAVPVVTLAVMLLPEDAATFATVGELPAAAPAAIVGLPIPFSE